MNTSALCGVNDPFLCTGFDVMCEAYCVDVQKNFDNFSLISIRNFTHSSVGKLSQKMKQFVFVIIVLFCLQIFVKKKEDLRWEGALCSFH